MTICSTKLGQFVEQKLMLSCSFRCEKIHDSNYEFGHTLFSCSNRTQVFNIPIFVSWCDLGTKTFNYFNYLNITFFNMAGSVVQGYDSRFGCERSRVQIPAEPNFLPVAELRLFSGLPIAEGPSASSPPSSARPQNFLWPRVNFKIFWHLF